MWRTPKTTRVQSLPSGRGADPIPLWFALHSVLLGSVTRKAAVAAAATFVHRSCPPCWILDFCCGARKTWIIIPFREHLLARNIVWHYTDWLCCWRWHWRWCCYCNATPCLLPDGRFCSASERCDDDDNDDYGMWSQQLLSELFTCLISDCSGPAEVGWNWLVLVLGKH